MFYTLVTYLLACHLDLLPLSIFSCFLNCVLERSYNLLVVIFIFSFLLLFFF